MVLVHGQPERIELVRLLLRRIALAHACASGSQATRRFLPNGRQNGEWIRAPARRIPPIVGVTLPNRHADHARQCGGMHISQTVQRTLGDVARTLSPFTMFNFAAVFSRSQRADSTSHSTLDQAVPASKADSRRARHGIGVKDKAEIRKEIDRESPLFVKAEPVGGHWAPI